jgi:hypothetical protein
LEHALENTSKAAIKGSSSLFNVEVKGFLLVETA